MEIFLRDAETSTYSNAVQGIIYADELDSYRNNAEQEIVLIVFID